MEQRVQKMLQMDGRKYGRTRVQLLAGLLGMGTPLWSPLFRRPMDSRQPWHDVKLQRKIQRSRSLVPHLLRIQLIVFVVSVYLSFSFLNY